MNDQKPAPTFAPLYCAIYPELADLARGHGYALAIHGSLQRDFDLIAVPWVEQPSKPKTVVESIEKNFAVKIVGAPGHKEHGREVWTLAVSFGECFLDLSFMPLATSAPNREER